MLGVLKKARDAAIVVLVGALMVGAWRVYEATQEIPRLAEASAKQQKDIATLKVSLVSLMQQTGHPPRKEDLEKLLSALGDYGKGAAVEIKRAEVSFAAEPALALYDWVPPSARDSLRRLLMYGARLDTSMHYYSKDTTGRHATLVVTNDARMIGALITSMMVSEEPVTWMLDGEYVRAKLTGGAGVVLSLKDTSRASRLVWINDANALRATIVNVHPGKLQPTPAPR